jgi:hypothetical protein
VSLVRQHIQGPSTIRTKHQPAARAPAGSTIPLFTLRLLFLNCFDVTITLRPHHPRCSTLGGYAFVCGEQLPLTRMTVRN